MHKNLSPFGQLEYIDERGYTPKASRRRIINDGLTKVSGKVQNFIDSYNVILKTNPATIVTDSHFNELTEILERSFKVWREVNYPFTELLLVRTDLWDRSIALSRPQLEIPFKDIKSAVNTILEEWQDCFPDQILIHPHPSADIKREKMIFAQIYAKPDMIIGHFGQGNIEQVRFITEADNQFQVKLSSGIEYKKYKGDFNEVLNREVVKRFMNASRFFLPFFYKYIIPKESRHRDISFEFQAIEHEGKLFVIYCDYDLA
jgi:hypothetical protein